MKHSNEKYTILVVDDLAQNRRILKNIARHAGYSVDECTNGIEAIQYVYNKKPDVILMDYKMPEISGPETIRQIRKINGLENVKVLMVTARNDSASVKTAISAGIDGYIIKPVNIHDVLTKIASLLN